MGVVKRRWPMMLAVVLTSLASALHAQSNLNFLSRSAVGSFTSQEWSILRATVRQALDDGEQGEEIGWHNDATGASGTITLLEGSELNGMSCRRTRFFNSAGGVTGTSTHRLCKTANGEWRLAH
jgi:hypothetical protein